MEPMQKELLKALRVLLAAALGSQWHQLRSMQQLQL
jgi:hypothetical protein